jgi:hypothetical protein
LKSDDNVVRRVQEWFKESCDGRWEHDFGVKIESTDNPGWWVTIDLNGTRLLGRPFELVGRGDLESNDPDPPWMRCYVEDGVFNGAGDPDALDEILKVFLEWADR